MNDPEAPTQEWYKKLALNDKKDHIYWSPSGQSGTKKNAN